MTVYLSRVRDFIRRHADTIGTTYSIVFSAVLISKFTEIHFALGFVMGLLFWVNTIAVTEMASRFRECFALRDMIDGILDLQEKNNKPPQ